MAGKFRMVALAATAASQSAHGALPPYTEALGEFLWEKAKDEVAGESTEKNERFVCAAGNWGDGPQSNQWDQGYSPCWPSIMTISASWDVDLMALWSTEIAEEFGVKSRGQLGPGINVARFAWNGRLGEYMAGEDPYFGAKMTKAMVEAYRSVPHPPLQTAKHFIPNTIEKNRNSIIEEVDERTLFEVYYPPFEAAVKAGVSGVMCSYNLVKCTSGVCSGKAAYACANDDILNKHLKNIMGFKGIVISDWDATKCQGDGATSDGCSPGGYIEKEFAADGGLDLEMPACQTFKGGASKRAGEKAARLAWANLVQGRDLSGQPLQRSATQLPGRRLDMVGDVHAIQWSNHPNKCLQVEGDGLYVGMRVQVWDCMDTPRQHFAWSPETSKIHWALYPKLCLDVSGHDFSNGSPVQLWECLQYDDEQMFAIPQGGKGKFRSKTHWNFCLDVKGHATYNGNTLQLWECLDSDVDQTFEAVKVTKPEGLAPDWSADQPVGSDGSLPRWQPKANGAAPTPAQTPAQTPSWHTGVYETNPFGQSSGAPMPAPSVAEAANVGKTPTKQDAPIKGMSCADLGGNNYKSPCKLALAVRIIAESTTVLKNEGGILPLKKDAKVALVGHQACAADPLAQGGGSGWNGFACNQVPKLSVRDGIAGLVGGPKLACPDGDGDNTAASSADIVLAVVAPKKAWEGSDRETLQLDAVDVEIIKKYTLMGKKVVVAMNAPGPIITSTWDDKVAGITVSWLPGQQNGRGIAKALYNEDYDASGRLPFTFPKCNTATCSQQDEYDSVHLGNQIASGEYTKFTEKALIGYRWYHAKGKTVSYPFGFGLFAYGSAQVQYTDIVSTALGASAQITVMLKHNGPREGFDVPQLYLSFPSSVPGDAESKPEWVLKGFEKVLVKPGVPAAIKFMLNERDMSYWDEGSSSWVCAKGDFKACVGANARDAVQDGAACATFTMSCAEDAALAAMSKAELQALPPLGAHGRATSAIAAAAACAVALAMAASRLRPAPSGDDEAEHRLVKPSEDHVAAAGQLAAAHSA